jgi:hypothetical protein
LPPLLKVSVIDFVPELINGLRESPRITLIICEADIMFDIFGKFNIIDVEFDESTVMVNADAPEFAITFPDADRKKNVSLGLTADIISLSYDMIGVGAKKSKLNSVFAPTVKLDFALIPAIDLTVNGLIKQLVLSISLLFWVCVVTTIEFPLFTVGGVKMLLIEKLRNEPLGAVVLMELFAKKNC